MADPFFPIRCISCNKVIGNKYLTFKALEQNIPAEIEAGMNMKSGDTTETPEEAQEKLRIAAYDKIWTRLGITRSCCKRPFLVFDESEEVEIPTHSRITYVTQNTLGKPKVYECV